MAGTARRYLAGAARRPNGSYLAGAARRPNGSYLAGAARRPPPQR